MDRIDPIEAAIASRPTPSWWQVSTEETARGARWRATSGEVRAGLDAIAEVLAAAPDRVIVDPVRSVGQWTHGARLQVLLGGLVSRLGSAHFGGQDVCHVLFSVASSIATQRGAAEPHKEALAACRRLMPRASASLEQHAKSNRGLLPRWDAAL